MLWTKNKVVQDSYNLALEKSNYERKQKALKLLDFYFIRWYVKITQ